MHWNTRERSAFSNTNSIILIQNSIILNTKSALNDKGKAPIFRRFASFCLILPYFWGVSPPIFVMFRLISPRFTVFWDCFLGLFAGTCWRRKSWISHRCALKLWFSDEKWWNLHWNLWFSDENWWISYWSWWSSVKLWWTLYWSWWFSVEKWWTLYWNR